MNVVPRDSIFPRSVDCDAGKVDGARGICGATADYESENPRKGHAYYRCSRPGCRNLMVVCANGGHRQ